MHRRVVNLQNNVELPYSSAIVASGEFVFTSGHVGFDPETGIPPAGIEAQTVQALENLKAVLEAAGTSLDHVVNVKVYLANVEHYEQMNDVYRRYFPTNRPARATVGAQLVRLDLLVEFEMIALLPNGAEK